MYYVALYYFVEILYILTFKIKLSPRSVQFKSILKFKLKNQMKKNMQIILIVLFILNINLINTGRINLNNGE